MHEMKATISEVTRRAIIDKFILSKIRWSGRLTDVEFLGRIYDLKSMRSTDYRVKNASADIWAHRVQWNDWSDDWVFTDSRFDLLHTTDDLFLQFLCETVHPVVRPDMNEARNLVEWYNSQLIMDGWRIVEVDCISGKPIYGPEKGGERKAIFQEPTGWLKVDRQTQAIKSELLTARSEEHYQTVGLLCREVLISLAQEVFMPDKHKSIDGVEASNTDAKRMLEAFIEHELSGGSNKEARKHARASLDLALALQHKRSADLRTAALCAEATFSVVNIVAILSGRAIA